MTSTSTCPSSANSHLWAEKYQLAEEVHSLMNFKTGYDNFLHANASSLLSFDQSEKLSNHGLIENFNCCDTSSDYEFMINTIRKENNGDCLYTEATVVSDNVLDSRSQEAGRVKRPHTGDSMQALKKQCSANKMPKPKTVPYSKDPQTIAAKNRRERISERLKILQELVPNGSKVDLVTMLEKAIGYVKFLQLQVKVLATDEFWPAPGGKAPNISQVREAIDAILSSQRHKNSSSK